MTSSQPPYDSESRASALAPTVPPSANHAGVRWLVFSLNLFIVFLFPPTCCPCTFSYIGLIVQPYLYFLGMPAILIPQFLPQLVQDHPLISLSLYATNYVFVSYLVADFAGNWYGSKKLSSTEQTSHLQRNESSSKSDTNNDS